ncbi:hypothetical protein [Candidatus Reidiella endopervernicosa]|uniref:EpsG family protein n=1 Tax=Candidatus Reidiella endopervernicosa TaxID=2738883 RepID=A0A6N0HZP9_9GAMM|nr:hypothetical protein [Candidatus Reidiella endopervernicosa]QKQ27832.1 hypothetical protein HUE57_17235 [Candidatus Reidiella endopervernicosa]
MKSEINGNPTDLQSTQQKRPNKTANQTIFILIAALLFALSFTYKPLYTDNQNTKFLIAAGQTNHGQLSQDWLANSIDPLPIFTAIIRAFYELNTIELSYAAFLLLLLLYFLSLNAIAEKLFSIQTGSRASFIFILLFFSLHYAIPSVATGGMAYQYLLGNYFQPCVFGIFVFLSINSFLRKQTLFSSLWLSVAALLHPGAYIFPSLLLTASYGFIIYREQRSLLRALTLTAMESEVRAVSPDSRRRLPIRS